MSVLFSYMARVTEQLPTADLSRAANIYQSQTNLTCLVEAVKSRKIKTDNIIWTPNHQGQFLTVINEKWTETLNASSPPDHYIHVCFTSKIREKTRSDTLFFMCARLCSNISFSSTLWKETQDRRLLIWAVASWATINTTHFILSVKWTKWEQTATPDDFRLGSRPSGFFLILPTQKAALWKHFKPHYQYKEHKPSVFCFFLLFFCPLWLLRPFMLHSPIN